MLENGDRLAIAHWFGTPWVCVLSGIFLAVAFWHADLGIRVVLEDYVSHERRRSLLLRLTRASLWFFCISGIFSVLFLCIFGLVA